MEKSSQSSHPAKWYTSTPRGVFGFKSHSFQYFPLCSLLQIFENNRLNIQIFDMEGLSITAVENGAKVPQDHCAPKGRNYLQTDEGNFPCGFKRIVIAAFHPGLTSAKLLSRSEFQLEPVPERRFCFQPVNSDSYLLRADALESVHARRNRTRRRDLVRFPVELDYPAQF